MGNTQGSPGAPSSYYQGDLLQADKTKCEWYNLLCVSDGGEGKFVDIMKECNANKNYESIDNAIRTELRKYLYNDGEGKECQAEEIVHVRNCIRNGLPVTPWNPQNARSNGSENGAATIGSQSKVSPQQDEEAVNVVRGKNRLVCWDLYKRGAVGETIIHTAVLLANPLMIQLTKRMLKIFPRLIVDIYLSDQYFGENILHISIVNEDPQMVKYLLDIDTGLNSKDQRYAQLNNIHEEPAYGVFFACEDQKESRRDKQGEETMTVNTKTDYKGYVYWGEFPLSFAACVEQEECLRLLHARGARFDRRDHNGNTVLHMCVIHDKIEMFDLVLSLAGDHGAPELLTIKNKMGLTPLTLAAQMAHKDMYNHIIEKERKVYWVYGDVTCAAYPLDNIDSIGDGGDINETSALHLIIYGKKDAHLEMVDGMIVHLLKDKWQTFVKKHFALRMACFIFYFIIFTCGMLLRPGRDRLAQTIVTVTKVINGTEQAVNVTLEENSCYLLGPLKQYQDVHGYPSDDLARLVFECLSLVGVIIYFVLLARNGYYNGKKRFIEMLKSAPSMALFFVGCACFLLMVPARFMCSLPAPHGANATKYEDVMAVISILLTTMYFLFFCRGFKIVGPFIIMIYKMLTGDLLRFFTIYFIFLLGFSQAMFIVHINFNRPAEKTAEIPFQRLDYAIMGMFYMSMGEFTVMYEDLKYTQHEIMGKILFVFYMILVTLLLINMLIAMMGNTYTLVNETQKEWLRQWAHIILCVEQSVVPTERLKMQKLYSQPMDEEQPIGEAAVNGSAPNGTDIGTAGSERKKERRALAIRWHHTEREKEEIKKERETIKIKQKEILLKHSKKIQHRMASAQSASRQLLPVGPAPH